MLTEQTAKTIKMKLFALFKIFSITKSLFSLLNQSSKEHTILNIETEKVLDRDKTTTSAKSQLKTAVRERINLIFRSLQLP